MKPNDYVMIYWTAGSIDEARQVARQLVQEKLVACANIIPWIESIFSWNNTIDTQQETKVIFKTKKELFEKAKALLVSQAKYEVPEVLMVPILAGNEEYFDWVDESTQ